MGWTVGTLCVRCSQLKISLRRSSKMVRLKRWPKVPVRDLWFPHFWWNQSRFCALTCAGFRNHGGCQCGRRFSASYSQSLSHCCSPPSPSTQRPGSRSTARTTDRVLSTVALHNPAITPWQRDAFLSRTYPAALFLFEPISPSAVTRSSRGLLAACGNRWKTLEKILQRDAPRKVLIRNTEM